MVNNGKYFEIQSSHVKKYLADYINIENKNFYIKSDIDVSQNLFLKPKQYDFNKTIKILYIVGPHFLFSYSYFFQEYFPNSRRMH